MKVIHWSLLSEFLPRDAMVSGLSSVVPLFNNLDDQNFKGMPSFDVQYLRNDARHGYNATYSVYPLLCILTILSRTIDH